MEQRNKPVWQNYMPDYIELYYVNHNDDLDNRYDWLQQCVAENSLYSLDEKVLDLWDYPEGDYLDEIEKKMDADGLHDEFVAHEDEIKDWIWEHDKSTPVEDLLSHTTDPTFFYSLGIELDHGWHSDFMVQPWRNQSCAQSAYRIRQLLGIKKGTPEADKILELCEESTYGGELRIYFEEDVREVISGEPYFLASSKSDWEAIRFKGVFKVAVWDNTNGAGYYVDLPLDKEFPFIRKNLQISEKAEKWDIESACGLCGDWLRGNDVPDFSFEKPKKNSKVKISKAVAQEQKFQKLFAEGKCSPLDNNIERHRDVYYRNDVPCGMYCPHCGKVWYD